MVQLVLNVVVLGFWCGQFLSLSLLRGWIANGFDPIIYLPTLIILATAVLMPFSATSTTTARGFARLAVCKNWLRICLS